jgi:hypothetical protein
MGMLAKDKVSKFVGHHAAQQSRARNLGSLFLDLLHAIQKDISENPATGKANGTKLSALRQITFDERSDLPYAWTLDSQSVLFISNRNGNFNVFKQNVDDTEPEILVSGPEDIAIPRLSPDGKTILYLVPPKAGYPSVDVRLVKMPLAGGPPRTVLVMPEASNQQCARLPSTVCIISRIQSGRERFFYFDVDKGLGAEIKNAEVESSNSLTSTGAYRRTEGCWRSRARKASKTNRRLFCWR